MTNCLDCNRCNSNKYGNAVCRSEDSVEHLILERKLYDSDKEFRAALFECGRDCDKFVTRGKAKNKKPANGASKEAPEKPAPNIIESAGSGFSFKQGLGWIVASSLAGVLTVTYLMICMGVM